MLTFDGADAAEMFDYKGMHVTADHAVLEEGQFCRVKDSRAARKLKSEHPGIVHDVITTGHRIHVPVPGAHHELAQVFADYIELPYDQQEDVYDLFLARLNQDLASRPFDSPHQSDDLQHDILNFLYSSA